MATKPKTMLKQFRATPVHAWCCSNTLELRLCMFGAAQVLLKRFGATPVHVWCSAGHQSMQQKYEITLCQRDLKCGEASFE